MKAFFAGSFDPFTIGHKDIVDRALALCDHVVIAIGYNINKGSDGLQARIDAITNVYGGNPQVSVVAYSGLTVDAARRCGCDVLLRSVRSVKDFEYERDLADINMRISQLDTIILFARPELAAVSSSVVRELAYHGHDINSFLPQR